MNRRASEQGTVREQDILRALEAGFLLAVYNFTRASRDSALAQITFTLANCFCSREQRFYARANHIYARDFFFCSRE